MTSSMLLIVLMGAMSTSSFITHSSNTAVPAVSAVSQNPRAVSVPSNPSNPYIHQAPKAKPPTPSATADAKQVSTDVRKSTLALIATYTSSTATLLTSPNTTSQ
ncbi:hypothetical protein VOLCADRAFT_90389 [Volvox carteri f. nagariensis]|uniref:Uncharacterized protein n=1 Tax=Volvox carteri f. nagariensis TaxID=3068 RepID=D8TU87_VOLCA|nr:uncharacterized protein VOLCADRAFT_90389 [Volvox carteri f. nagariensis]EFJ48994.1 hypothetical protein VOLCADRAFT_90389 [Volvox carteri f. nagariensis]|eukprot:XP_002949891.1 hypothetical protein VOLCADRAFT_90389 [Volvox carteri f. nagariensis]